MATATILFTDVADSAGMLARVGDLENDRLRRRHDELVRHVVARHHGELVKHTGDGVLATFESASEGVAAAVDAQRALALERRSGRLPFDIRIGLSTGDVTREGADVFGGAVVEASRISAAAAPGQILCSQLVAQVARGRCESRFTEAGTQHLKGLPDPVALLEVDWQPSEDQSSPGLPPTLVDATASRFVGRRGEIDSLDAAWRAARGGDACLVVVAGEPGAGKTRLVGETAGNIAEEGIVLYGQCRDGSGVPFEPFTEGLRTYVHSTASPRLGEHAAELTRLLPEIADRVAGTPHRGDLQTEQYRLFDAVLSWVTDVAASSAVLLALDDAHWADTPTVRLLQYVWGGLRAEPVLVVVCHRDETSSRPLDAFLAEVHRHQRRARWITLEGFDVDSVRALVETTLGEGDAADLAAAIHDRTDGNAFLVDELLRDLRTRDAISRSNEGKWVADPTSMGAPRGVGEVVRQRLRSVPASTADTVSLASVLGQEFDPDFVARLAGASTASVMASLDHAVAVRILAEVPGPLLRYRFTHGLVRDAIYQELSGTQRTLLHADAGEAIEALRGPTAVFEIANHYVTAAASDLKRAVDWAMRAGQTSMEALAAAQAAGWFRKAVEILDAAGERASEADVDALLALGEAQRLAGAADFRSTLLDAFAAAERLNDGQRMAKAALANNVGLYSQAGSCDDERVAALRRALDANRDGDTVTRARLLATLAVELIWAPDAAARFELADQAVGDARRAGDERALADVLAQKTEAIWTPWTVTTRLQDTAELVEIAERNGDRTLRTRAWLERAVVVGETGDFAEFDRLLERAGDEADALRHPVLKWRAALLRAGRAGLRGDLDDLERLAEAAYRQGRSAGREDALLPMALQLAWLFDLRGHSDETVAAVSPEMRAGMRPDGQALLALAQLRAGDAAGAEKAFDRLWEGLPDVRPDIVFGRLLVTLAELAIGLGHHERAALLGERLAPHAGILFGAGITWEPVTAQVLGRIASLRGDLTLAEQYLERAVGVHERIGAAIYAAADRLELVRARLRCGKPGAAEAGHATLPELVESFRARGAERLVRDAVALLAEART